MTVASRNQPFENPPQPEPDRAADARSPEVEELRARLAEAEEMLAAIRNGEVDALVVIGSQGDRVYTLEGAETPYRQLVEQMQEGAVIVGADGTILYSNQRFAEIVCIPLERLIGSSIHPLAAPEDTEAFLSTLELGRSEACKHEVSLRCPGGPRVPVLLAASPLPGDKSSRTCVVVTDLRAQKRTQGLEEAKEALARKALELARSNDDLTNFAHVAAHDLKEPLRGIRHLVGFLLEDYGAQLGNEGRLRLDTLDRLTGRMHALLDSMLEYSRVGQEKLRDQNTDLALVVGEVLASLGPWLRERSAEVVVGPLPSARCDPVLAGRLFQNLIANAAKYNDSVPRRVEVGVQACEGAQAYFVRDNGIGIAPEHHANVFRMFKRIARQDTYGGGTGAGLTIAKRIVERHGGRIWLESAPGRGSTFYFTLGPSGPRA